MPLYRNFVNDYPDRCLRILKRYHKSAELKGVEVTLMLAIASTGLIVPLERLKRPFGKNPEHPSRDRERLTDAIVLFDNLLKEPFWNSTLWPSSEGSWLRGKLELHTVENNSSDPGCWAGIGNAERVAKDICLETVLANLRNALAHGNIFVLPKANREIGEIIFLKEDLKKNQDGKLERESYTFIICSPNDFRDFMSLWFQFLKGLPIPQDVIPESINFGYAQSEAAA